MKRENFRIGEGHFSDCGWYIAIKDKPRSGKGFYLWKDLCLHKGSGYEPGDIWNRGEAPGYYWSKEVAQLFLTEYLKTKDLINEKAWEIPMNNVEITVKVNGEDVPLVTITAEKLEELRKIALEPKYEGVLVGDYKYEMGAGRVFFEVTDVICKHMGKIIALDENGYVVHSNPTLRGFFKSGCYENIRKLGD